MKVLVGVSFPFSLRTDMGGGSWGIPQARGIGLALVDPAELFSEGVVPVWPTARYSLLCNNSKSVLNPTTE